MATPVRFPNGVTNSGPASLMRALPIMDPTAAHVWFDDFDQFTAGDWTITTTEAGAGDATEAVGNADGGVLVITNDAADNDADFLQWGRETFRIAAGKKLWFKARLKVSDATQSDLVFGLQITDTTPLAVSDGIYFQSDDGDANLDFHVTKNGTSSSKTAAATLADDTWIEAGFYYNGVDTVEAWVGAAKVADLPVTNLPDDEDLTISFGIQNGEAAAKVLSVDYIFVAKER